VNLTNKQKRKLEADFPITFVTREDILHCLVETYGYDKEEATNFVLNLKDWEMDKIAEKISNTMGFNQLLVEVVDYIL